MGLLSEMKLVITEIYFIEALILYIVFGLIIFLGFEHIFPLSLIFNLIFIYILVNSLLYTLIGCI